MKGQEVSALASEDIGRANPVVFEAKGTFYFTRMRVVVQFSSL
jgi:hypothetical protein